MAAIAVLGAGLPAQTPPTSPPAGKSREGASRPLGRSDSTPARTADQKRGSRPRATHAPQPHLPPALVLDHLKRSSAAVVRARAERTETPKPRRRPAAAGRYLCAVFACSDADLDVASALGLRRRDVLVISNPGPFVTRESVALLEHQVERERLALVLVLTHSQCDTLTRRRPTTRAQNALDRRVEEARSLARRNEETLTRAFARRQCEMLLASSRTLQERQRRDSVRVLAAEIDPRTLRLTWHTSRADEMPMKPIK